MTDAEVEIRYHEMQLAKLRGNKNITTVQATEMLTPTDTYFYFEACPTCGNGRVPQKVLNGWYIAYRYQDGHEECGPYSRDEAVEMYSSHRDNSVMATLIGSDNRVYILKGK